MNLHDKPFDETTITKLKLFEDYAQEWIPTFLMQSRVNEIHIFDFFAGTGYDKNGVAGSPIRLLDKVFEQRGNMFKNNVQVVIHLNEYDTKKYNQLELACNEKLKEENGITHKLEIKYYNQDFESLFPVLFPVIEMYPSLVYLDQNGIKFLSDQYLKLLEKTKETDFLYFASSSYILRFGELDEFKKHLDIDLEILKKSGYNKVHRTLTELLRQKIAQSSQLKLYPFSLRKGQNIYGIVFGATHPLAVDKFLNITWKYNGVNGDANFDIDNEANLGQLDMFSGARMSKIENFKHLVKDKLLSESITTNEELLNFVYENGHIGKHAAEAVKELKQEGKLIFASRSPCVTYDNVFKNRKIIRYEKI